MHIKSPRDSTPNEGTADNIEDLGLTVGHGLEFEEKTSIFLTSHSISPTPEGLSLEYANGTCQSF